MPTTPTTAVREAWLLDAIEALRPIIKDPIPAVRVSVGFPKGARGKSSAIGQCWYAANSADKTNEVFISPVLAEPVRVLDVLAHELCHAVAGSTCGHKGAFKKLATRIGLTGKMTATVAGPELKATLEAMAKTLGPYPHAVLSPGGKGGPKKQGTRMHKVLCPSCGYTVRTTEKWLAVGCPVCPCGEEMREA